MFAKSNKMENNYNDIKLPGLDDSKLYRMIRGAVSKEYVIKKYGKKRVISKYPDMTNIIPSAKQIKRRMIFKEAVRFAGTIYTDEKLRCTIAEFAGTKKGLFQAAIRYYFLKSKKANTKRSRQTDNLLRTAFDKEQKVAKETTSWTDNPGMVMAKANGKSMVVVHCPELNESMYELAGAPEK